MAGKKKGREYYLAKIEQAETFARKVSDNSARESLEKIAQGYRALLRRLESLKV